MLALRPKNNSLAARRRSIRKKLATQFEVLERRELLTGDLIAHWRADSLDGTFDDGAIVTEWTDLVGGVNAASFGNPTVAAGAIGGRTAIRFAAGDGRDGLQIDKATNPLNGANDFSVAVVFATASNELVGANGHWFENTGLVDANEFGISADWGMSINSQGQLSAGMGGGFLEPKITAYSTVDGLNDNQTHTAVLTRSGSTISLFVDGQSVGSRSDANGSARAPTSLAIGMLNSQTNAFNGDISEVQLFNGALDAGEISAMFNQISAYYDNTPAAAADDQYSLAEDTAFFFKQVADGVLSNDTDPDGDALSAVLIDGTKHGELNLNADGSFVYVPETDFFGVDSFTYVAQDFRESNIATVTLTVTPEYDQAQPVADSYKSISGQSLNVSAANGLLANDLNPDAATLRPIIQTDVTAGNLTIFEDGSFEYAPLGFAGTMTFTYQLDDGTTVSAAETVTLTINTPPEAVDDTLEVNEDESLELTAANGILANDIDPEANLLTATIVDAPSHGQIVTGLDGSLTYVPVANYSGTDLFTYTITDGIDDAAGAATVIVNVKPVNDGPDALPDTYFGLLNTPIEIIAVQGVLQNDVDIDSVSDLTAEIDQPPTNGTISLETDGSFQYQPNEGFTGTDTFSYRASDGSALSEPAVVTIAINSLEQQQQIVISEIHSNPDINNELVEFVELYNRGDAPVDLSGWRFTDGVDFVFPDGASIEAGGYMVAAQDPVALQAKFTTQSVGPWDGQLRNSGEKLELRTPAGSLIDEVNYGLGFPWPTVGDDPGFSMHLVNPAIDNDLGGAWRSAAPTPNALNSSHVENAAPRLRQVSHVPKMPSSGQAVTITMKVTDPDGVASVNLDYQLVDPGSYIRLTDDAYRANWTTVAMSDDGMNGDAIPGDGVFTTVLPADLQTNRRLVRYRIHAEDNLGAVVTGPYADDPQPNFAYYVYDGVPDWTGSMRPGREPDVTYSAEAISNVAIYQLIADEQDVSNSQWNSRFNGRQFRGTFVYDGEVYDHIEFRNRGNASTYQVGKNKWKLNFTRGHGFEARDDYGNKYNEAWDKMNILPGSNPWWRNDVSTDGTVLYEPVAFKLYELAGTPSSKTQYFQFRVVDSEVEANPNDQYDGDFWGLYMAIEQPDGNFLDERGLPDGNIYNVHGSSSGSSLRNEGSLLPNDKSDLRDFIRNNARANTLQWWQENLNFDSYFAFNAINLLVNNSDLRPNENVNYYHNQETGQWYTLPWDLDLTFEDRPHWSKPVTAWESIQRVIGRYPEVELAYQNHVREVFDLLIHNGDTSQIVDEYVNILVPNDGAENIVEANQALWDYHPRKRKKGIWYKQFNRSLLPEQSFEGLATYMKNFMVDDGFGYELLEDMADDTGIPNTPTISYVGAEGFPISDLQFQSTDFSDADGDETFAAIEWRLAEIHNATTPGYDSTKPYVYEIEGTWTSGALDERNLSMEIPGNDLEPGKTYRARVRMQDVDGHWSHWSDAIEFQATAGTSVLAETLRISEVHYHPADPTDAELAAGHLDSDDFEFIELVNIGAQTIDLTEAQLTKVEIDGDNEGVDFDFSAGAITQLEPGGRVVVVEDLDAFTFRYGNEIPVAGQWSGQLGNRSETITLAALGEPILQFAYADDWHATTDGDGPSLEFINPASADPAAWSQSASWQPSQQTGGTPGTDSAVLIAGDSNRDGVFNSSDLVLVFTSNEYEDDVDGNSTWEEGDWNGDGDFTSSDLVFAFTAATYTAAAVGMPGGQVVAAQLPQERTDRNSLNAVSQSTVKEVIAVDSSTPTEKTMFAQSIDLVFEREFRDGHEKDPVDKEPDLNPELFA